MSDIIMGGSRSFISTDEHEAQAITQQVREQMQQFAADQEVWEVHFDYDRAIWKSNQLIDYHHVCELLKFTASLGRTIHVNSDGRFFFEDINAINQFSVRASVSIVSGQLPPYYPAHADVVDGWCDSN